ncbi:MAG: thrombospondin type 3 repeat-containing protein [Patescibacteria group bacterium]
MEGDHEKDAIYQPKNPANSARKPGDFLLSRFSRWPKEERSKKEKILANLVLVAAFAGLLFGFFNLTYRIKNPFDYLFKNNNANTNSGKECASGNCEEEKKLAALLALKVKDTDEDGLPDYDELYTYKTSPYLADSDSDGFSDKEEVDKGFDPNCPGKESCFTSGGGAATGETGTPTFGVTPNTQMAGVTPDLVRQLLVQAGATQEQVAALSDTELMALFQEAAAQNSDQINQWNAQAASGGTDTGQSQLTNTSVTSGTGTVDVSNITIKSMDDLKNLTGAQLRQLMINSGASADLLSQVSDDDLKTMFLEKLNEGTASQ